MKEANIQWLYFYKALPTGERNKNTPFIFIYQFNAEIIRDFPFQSHLYLSNINFPPGDQPGGPNAN